MIQGLLQLQSSPYNTLSRPDSVLRWRPVAHASSEWGRLAFVGCDLGAFAGMQVLPSADGGWWVQFGQVGGLTSLLRPIPHRQLGTFFHLFLGSYRPSWRWGEYPVSAARTSQVRNSGRVGFVYFLQEYPSGLVKIGFSSSPAARISNLRSSGGQQRELLGLLPAVGMDAEARMHSRFSKAHARGEWFHPSEEMARLLWTLPPFGWGAVSDGSIRKIRV